MGKIDFIYLVFLFLVGESSRVLVFFAQNNIASDIKSYTEDLKLIFSKKENLFKIKEV